MDIIFSLTPLVFCGFQWFGTVPLSQAFFWTFLKNAGRRINFLFYIFSEKALIQRPIEINGYEAKAR